MEIIVVDAMIREFPEKVHPIHIWFPELASSGKVSVLELPDRLIVAVGSSVYSHQTILNWAVPREESEGFPTTGAYFKYDEKSKTVKVTGSSMSLGPIPHHLQTAVEGAIYYYLQRTAVGWPFFPPERLPVISNRGW